MHRSRYIAIGLFLGLSVAGALGLRAFYGMPRTALQATRRGAGVSPLARALRPNYPYSVIPGGAYSPAELRAAIRRDPLVRGHYSNFNLNNLQLTRVTQAHYSFVSYRQDNHIFWTRKRLKIPAGEILLTDGKNYAKTRCGNRLSEVPMGNTAPAELPAGVLSPPPIEADRLAGLDLVPAPVLSEGEQIAPPASVPYPAATPLLQPETGYPGLANSAGSTGLGGPGGPGASPYTDTSGAGSPLAGLAGSAPVGSSPEASRVSNASAGLRPITGLPASTSVSPSAPTAVTGGPSAVVPEPSYRVVFILFLGAIPLITRLRTLRRAASATGENLIPNLSKKAVH